MLATLDKTLRTVPFLSTLGIRVEEAKPGHLVLRLPWGENITNHGGAIHSAAVFAVGELAAAVALGTQGQLSRIRHLQKSTKIKYYLPSTKDVTAHCTITSEMVTKVTSASAGTPTTLEVPVRILDGHGQDVAELVSNFAFRVR